MRTPTLSSTSVVAETIIFLFASENPCYDSRAWHYLPVLVVQTLASASGVL